MPIARHGLAAQTMYRDLLDLLLDEAAAEIRGTPTIRRRGNRNYWYDRYRVGDEVRERYLGEDAPDLRTRIGAFEALQSDREARARERARMVRLLRAERFLGVDATTGSLLSAMAASGFFRLGGVLVGTNAFRLYEGELALRLRLDQGAMTRDVDIASFERVSLALAETEVVMPGPEATLRDLSFEPLPTIDRGRVWRWRQTRGRAIVEFLTPSFSASEDLRELPSLGVSAQSLHYLNFLIGDPIPAAIVYRDGVLVRVPRPERFAVHKLIVADRRRDGADSLKARKDRLQAELLVEVLVEERPEALAEAFSDARGRGPKWRERLDRSLARSPATAALLRDLVD